MEAKDETEWPFGPITTPCVWGYVGRHPFLPMSWVALLRFENDRGVNLYSPDGILWEIAPVYFPFKVNNYWVLVGDDTILSDLSLKTAIKVADLVRTIKPKSWLNRCWSRCYNLIRRWKTRKYRTEMLNEVYTQKSPWLQ